MRDYRIVDTGHRYQIESRYAGDSCSDAWSAEVINYSEWSPGVVAKHFQSYRWLWVARLVLWWKRRRDRIETANFKKQMARARPHRVLNY